MPHPPWVKFHRGWLGPLGFVFSHKNWKSQKIRYFLVGRVDRGGWTDPQTLGLSLGRRSKRSASASQARYPYVLH